MHIVETGNITILNDAYNANPTSMAAAIDIVAKTTAKRRVCILGDMFELGPESAHYHKSIGQHAAQRGIDLILCVGQWARHIYEGAEQVGGNALYFSDKGTLLRSLDSLISSEDAVLVKASRGMRLDIIVDWLTAHHSNSYT